MTFSEFRKATILCRNYNPREVDEGKNDPCTDAVLAAVGSMESDLSLLEDSVADDYAGCQRVALLHISTHRMGYYAKCGCFGFLWYHKEKQSTLG